MSVNVTGYTYTLPDGQVYTWSGSNANCTVAHCPVTLSVYGYRPSLPLSIILIALYAICAIVQLGLAWKYKTWGFCAAMVAGCIDEIIGYIGRIMMVSRVFQTSVGMT